MKRLLLALSLITSSLASDISLKCNVFQLLDDDSHIRFEKIDTLDLGRSLELGRPIKNIDNIGLKIKQSSENVMSISIIEGHRFSYPAQRYLDVTANVEKRPFEIRITIKGEILNLHCGKIKT